MVNTVVRELKVKVYLLKDIEFKHVNAAITGVIDKCLGKNEDYLKFHKNNNFKNYCFNLLYPLEKTKVYSAGNIYTFIVRSIDDKFADFILRNIVNEYTDKIKVLTINNSEVSKKAINYVYSITPVVIKLNDGYWRNNISIEEFEKRLKENIIKKYNDFYNTKINEDFEIFNHIKFNNIKPIATNYKNVNILGDKLSIEISQNSMAQELAYFMLGVGLGEMNSRSFGFVNFKWL